MKISEIFKGKPVKIKQGNRKTIRQYVPADEIPDLANPIARVVQTQPHLRQRAFKNKMAYDRKKLPKE